MSKGQRNHARQPVARVKGRETSQPRQPAPDRGGFGQSRSGKPGGSSLIKAVGAPASGKAPQAREGQGRSKPGFGQRDRTPPGQAPFGRRDERGQQGFGRDERQEGKQGFGQRDRNAGRDERQPSFGRDGQGQQGKQGFGQRDRNAGRDERQPSFGRDGQGQQGKQGFGQRDRNAGRDERQPAMGQAGQGEPRRDWNEERQPTSRQQDKRAPKVERAKKLRVRDPNQQILDRAQRLRDTRVDMEQIEPVRLQKALAASGVGSRREMEEWIEAGLILVNGKKATLGDRVGPQDRVTAKGNPIRLKWPDRLPRVILYHKQEGELVTRDDPEGRVTIFDRLPQAKSSRWVAVGRLDVNTSGLLIVTTSGELANRLMHPSFEAEREYAVRVLGQLEPEQMKEMTRGIELEDGPAHFQRIVEQGGEGVNHWYRVVIKEGRNREVRRIFEHFGLTVSRLIRVRFGNIGLPARLKRGQFYELNSAEVAAVMKWSDLTVTGRAKSR
ncbi:RNA-binding S4 domain protein [Pseudogulbenkiania ferrooxidans 2002]|uniref:Pseudouridine synthase n=2 Tax=Pseudogulbenkiania ferrooxidans TaxID=549169 RepID=B9Z6M4_9NEIS|nr:RNA-binding S4 domain protein [Pseudogulbenkiania ferrooxidans 2002]